MASYTELRGLVSDDALRNRVTVAVLYFANNLIQGTPTSADNAFALAVVGDPNLWGRRVMNLVLVENGASTIAQITGATDAQLQTAVDLVTPALRDALAGA